MDKKNASKILLGCLLITIFLTQVYIGSVLATTDGIITYTDPADDIHCFTEEQLEAYDWDYYTGDPDDIIKGMREFWNHGTVSNTPDSIDMIQITVDNEYSGNTSIRITITVQGTVDETTEALFLIYSNCSDGFHAGWVAIYTEYGETYVEAGYTGDESEEWEEMTVNINEAKNELSFVLPKCEENEECDLTILAFSFSETGEILCADIFPNAILNANPLNPIENDKPIAYAGWDPITNFFDDLGNILFGIMCSRLSFLFFMALLLILGKCLIDRKNIYAKCSGGVLIGLITWMITWYMITINFTTEDPVLDFSLVALIDLITCIFFLVFVAFTYLNQFKLVNDGEWSWVLGYCFMIVESILFITPWYAYESMGSPLTTLIILLVGLIPAIIFLFLTEKYSKRWLP